MRVRQFRYAADNFGYLLYTERSALAVDGGAVRGICAFIESEGLKLEIITNTHQHGDHTCGNRGLIDQTGAPFIDNRTLRPGQTIELDGETIEVYHTPGHSEDSICFRADNAIITGDTLFNGTIGNCFTGNLEEFYHSIKTLLALPDATIVYAGHDYVRDSLIFAQYLEPENEAIDSFLGKFDPAHVFSTLEEERAINPYLRFNDPAIIALLERNGLPVATELERWNSLMRIG
ncbi:MAG: MBL fold metallo-hydrolase [Syntrophales bacterium]|jgi:hydroxyacylglutathione hydrolase|nr:MBL fold metallo-hydrolase [Syntrophales bacterium]